MHMQVRGVLEVDKYSYARKYLLSLLTMMSYTITDQYMNEIMMLFQVVWLRLECVRNQS